MVTYDYTNQCYLIDGIIQTCGHTTACFCYGRIHAGEFVPEAVNVGKVSKHVWTKEEVKVWLAKCDGKGDCAKTRAIVTRALLFMYGRQTADEQSSQYTKHSNGAGFGYIDAEFLSNVAQQCIKHKRDVTPGQFVPVRKRLMKYTGQLVDFANSL